MRTVLAVLILAIPGALAACGGATAQPLADAVPPSVTCDAIADSSPVPLAPIANGVGSVVSDGTTVFWSDSVGNINEVPVQGGAPTLLASIAASQPGCSSTGCVTLSLALDPTTGTLYFASPGGIGSIPKGGGVPVQLTSSQSNGPPAISNGALYWAEGYPSQFYRLALPQGTPEMLTPPETAAVPGLVADATSLYWADGIGASVNKMPLAGGPTTQLVPPPLAGGNAPGFVVSGGRVYWTINPENGGCNCEGPQSPAPASTVNAVSVDGGDVTVLASSLELGGIAADDQNVYWLDYYADALDFVPTGGGAPQPVTGSLHLDEANEVGLAVDACNVYLVANGAIERVAKPH
jgi:hypothetical protein